MAGGTPLYTTQTYAVEFPGGPSFAPLFHAKGGDLDARPSANPAKYNPSFLSAGGGPSTHSSHRFKFFGWLGAAPAGGWATRPLAVRFHLSGGAASFLSLSCSRMR